LAEAQNVRRSAAKPLTKDAAACRKTSQGFRNNSGSLAMFAAILRALVFG
jgi:hypothetical protein